MLRVAVLAAMVPASTFTLSTAAPERTQGVAQLHLLDLACTGENDWVGSDALWEDEAGTGIHTVNSFWWETTGRYALRYEVN